MKSSLYLSNGRGSGFRSFQARESKTLVDKKGPNRGIERVGGSKDSQTFSTKRHLAYYFCIGKVGTLKRTRVDGRLIRERGEMGGGGSAWNPDFAPREGDGTWGP